MTVSDETTNAVPDGVGTGADRVEVRVPADGAYVATLRLTAASLAARCELTIDDIEDLRLAVDEACALLLPHAPAGSVMDATYQLSPGGLSVTTTVDDPGADGSSTDGPDRSGFAWSVLSALASDVEVHSADGRLTITVVKRRGTASQ